MDATTKEWLWKMNYCRNHRLPAAQSWAWEIACKAYVEYTKTKQPKD